MDGNEIRKLRPLLLRHLRRFDKCFDRADTRSHLLTYVMGLLSDLLRKSVEPIATAADISPRTLQQFLNLLRWDHDGMRDRVQQLVAKDHASPHSIGIIDETSVAKKGVKSPGVQRQWCGSTGKTDNCMVTVHLAYAVETFHCLLDGELYLPQSWDSDRQRCRAAGVPDTIVYRPKWQIALELLDRSRRNGVEPQWLTFDEGYGGKPPFLRALHERERIYVAEVPKSFTGWILPPSVTSRPARRRRGKPLNVPRLVKGAQPARSVAHHFRNTPALRDAPWTAFHVKEGAKGPMVWEAKNLPWYSPDVNGLPADAGHLFVARNVLEPEQVKYFVSNASPTTTLDTLLMVAFSRWHIERCFEDEKTELGFDHYEGRHYVGLKRHQLLAAVAHLFLAEVHARWRGKNPEWTVCQVRTAAASMALAERFNGRSVNRLLTAAADAIATTQKNNAKARVSHTKKTREKLREKGIDMAKIQRCSWA